MLQLNCSVALLGHNESANMIINLENFSPVIFYTYNIFPRQYSHDQTVIANNTLTLSIINVIIFQSLDNRNAVWYSKKI